MNPIGTRAVAAMTVAAGMAVFCVAQPLRAAETAMTCANLASGATWRMIIDIDKGTVDSYPADIAATKISWHDPRDGGNYTLERKSGALTVIIASSTGGYFLHDRCEPAH